MNKHMKTVFALLLALAVTLSTGAYALALEKGAELYSYNAATAAGEWQHFTRGAWTYDADGISVANNDGRTGDDAWYYTYFGNTKGWKNYVIDCDLSGVGEGGIIFRTSNPSDATVDAFDGYYCGTDSDFIFFGRDNGDKWKPIEKDGPDASYCYKNGYKQQMHWTIYVEDNCFTLYIDNAKFATAQVLDTDKTYPSGGIGVRYRVYPGDESGYIQNIKVTELTDGTSATQSGTAAESKVSSDAVASDTSKAESASSEDTSSDTDDSDDTAKETGSETVTVREETNIPAWLWVLLAVLSAAVIAVPVIMIVIVKKEKRG